MLHLSALIDVWTVSTSILDIVTDVLVCKQFYENDYRIYFILSMTIFCAASAAYAFLFVATYVAENRGVLTRMVVFLAALPFSQLLPIFHWLESFHIETIDKMLWKTKILVPTVALAASSGCSKVEDQLWTMLQSAYTRHAGFMAEAIMEALPQAALQTYAAATGAATTIITVVSIILSALVIVSKGYILAYSIEPMVAVFNASCIAHDIFTIFANTSWLATRSDVDPIGKWLLFFLFWALVTLVIGLACAHLFIVCDDHLKQYRSQISRPQLSIAGSPVWFELYVVRGLALFCTYLPAMAIFVTARLVALPLFVFRSLDAKHALHYEFYAFIFRQWLTGPNFVLRLEALNEIISAAHRSAPALNRAIRANPDPLEHRAVRKRWINALATPKEWRAAIFRRQGAIRWQQHNHTADINFEQEERRLDIQATENEKFPKSNICRRLLHRFWHHVLSESDREVANDLWHNLLDRSDILSFYDRSSGDLGGAPANLSLLKYPFQTFLILLGSSSLILGLLIFLIFLPFAIAFHALGALYAPFRLFAILIYPNDQPKNVIGITLTVTMLIVSVPLLVLAPNVHRFRVSRDRLTSTRNLPEFIYDNKRIRGIVCRRYLAKRARHAIRENILNRLNGSSDVTDYILDSFLGGDHFFKYDFAGLALWQLYSFHKAHDDFLHKKIPIFHHQDQQKEKLAEDTVSMVSSSFID
uniref:Uncharacterized protein n=1 Tax=Aureoumbra lagunensis TaxID=44058 RepID=A0A7S3K1F7_9STRA|mmetsp:Transcript_6324/g.8884  ORF Transcript_6324/g.8884 Transcript_6324/m.8884 type:complete len:703 (+) Transcript_6324:45-2153(+)